MIHTPITFTLLKIIFDFASRSFLFFFIFGHLFLLKKKHQKNGQVKNAMCMTMGHLQEDTSYTSHTCFWGIITVKNLPLRLH